MWISLVPTILSAAVLLLLPGGLVVMAAGLRLPSALGVVPAVSIAMLTVSGILASLSGVRWGAGVVVAMTTTTSLLALAARLTPRCRVAVPAVSQLSQPPRPWFLVCCWALAALLMTVYTARVLGAPDALSQTFDAVFHYNAVKHILVTGNASSLSFTMQEPSGAIYPVGWHTLVAMAMSLSGETYIPTATNAVALTVASLVWPLGSLVFVHRLLNGRRLALVATSVLASTTPAFPMLLLNWGVLYPNFLALSLLPGTLAALVDLFPGHDEPSPPPLLLPVGVIAVVGIALSHPNVVLTFLISLMLLLGVWVLRAAAGAYRGGALRLVWLRLMVMATAVAGTALLWVFMRPERSAAVWDPSERLVRSLAEVLASAPVRTPVVWSTAVLALIGLVVALQRPRLRWLGVLHLISNAMFVVCVSFPNGPFRFFVSGAWYMDANRLAAVIPLTVVPLAALGIVTLADTAHTRWSSQDWLKGMVQHRRCWYPVVAIVLTLVGPATPAMSQAVHIFSASYGIGDDTMVLTEDELALIERIPEVLGEEADKAVIAVDPWQGAALTYAFTGIETSVKHLFFREDPALKVVEEHLDDASRMPEVCDALDQLGVEYALSFPGEIILDDEPFAGFEDLDTAEGFELVAKEGDASLYRITACG